MAQPGEIEASPKLDGRNMTMVLAPDSKAQAAKKEHEPPRTRTAKTTQESTPAEPAVETAAQDTPA